MEPQTTPKENSVVLLTGANRGYGFAIFSDLVKSNQYTHIISTTRESSSFQKKLSSCLEVSPSVKLIFVDLDLSSEESIRKASKEIAGLNLPIDLLINNAAFLTTQEHESAEGAIGVNFLGTSMWTQELIRLDVFQKNAAIINVSSNLGNVGLFNKIEDGQKIAKGSLEELTLFAKEMIPKLDIENEGNNMFKEGYYRPVYAFSKILLTRYTQLLGEDPLVKEKKIRVYCYHPGWLKTNENQSHSPLAPEEGLEILKFLIGLPYDDKLQGRFFNRDKISRDPFSLEYDYTKHFV